MYIAFFSLNLASHSSGEVPKRRIWSISSGSDSGSQTEWSKCINRWNGKFRWNACFGNIFNLISTIYNDYKHYYCFKLNLLYVYVQVNFIAVVVGFPNNPERSLYHASHAKYDACVHARLCDAWRIELDKMTKAAGLGDGRLRSSDAIKEFYANNALNMLDGNHRIGCIEDVNLQRSKKGFKPFTHLPCKIIIPSSFEVMETLAESMPVFICSYCR